MFKPKLARITAPLYALGYGFAIGAISHMYNLQWDGIVLQAVGATLAVFGVMLFLYATRIIKVNKKYVMIVVSAMAGIFVLYFAAFIASLFGADIAFWNDPTPLGIGISVVIVIVAAANLAINFAFIEQASNAGRTEVHGVVRRVRADGGPDLAVPRDPPAAEPAAPVARQRPNGPRRNRRDPGSVVQGH